MKRLCMIMILALTCCACAPLMHRTVAEQTVRLDKNLHELLPGYRLVLNDELEEAEKLPDGPVEDIKHDILLLDATLLLSEDMRKTADLTLKEK